MSETAAGYVQTNYISAVQQIVKGLMQYAPIVVFAFNRLDVLTNTIQSLKANPEAKDSDLFVFVDGARPHKEGEAAKVAAVQDFVKSIDGFKSVHYTFAEANKGLAKSIIGGTTEVINQYGKVIVVEDDLFVSRSFLRFMNQMLDLYEKDERIMQVSGYGCLLTKIGDYSYDAYINERGHSWSWGTWKDRWETVDWDVRDYEELKASKALQKKFNKRGSDLYKMLNGYMTGENNSWYIRFNYSMYKQGRYSVMPIRSLVRNDGFGMEATNCSNYNRYKVDFEIEHKGEFKVPERMAPCERIIANAVRYWSIPYRLYGKFMTYWTKMC